MMKRVFIVIAGVSAVIIVALTIWSSVQFAGAKPAYHPANVYPWCHSCEPRGGRGGVAK